MAMNVTGASSQLSVYDVTVPLADKSETILTIAPTRQFFIDGNDTNGSVFNQSTLATAISTVASAILNERNGNYSGPKAERHLGWTNLVLALGLCVLIVITVIGNTLVILSVLTTRRLRTVTNCFVMSLAVADWLVGIFVMPPAVALYLIGKLKC